MNIPELPTDNLYKFLAITGLILFITSTGYVMYNRVNLNRQVIDIEAQRQRLFIDNTTLARELELLDKDKMTPKEYTIYIKKIAEINSKNVEVWRLENLRRQITDTNNWIEWPLLVLVVVSIIVMAYGFEMWKKRLQVYQDEIIKNEAERSKANRQDKGSNLTTG